MNLDNINIKFDAQLTVSHPLEQIVIDFACGNLTSSHGEYRC